MTLPAHPAAALFPLLGEAELQTLAADIAKQGLLEPVWLYDDPELGEVLLDGRNREAACGLAGVPLTTRRYEGESPVAFVISENVRRRHLSAGQLAFIGVEAEPLFAAEAAKRKGGRPRKGEEKPVAERPQVKARDQAAKVAGASGRGVARAKHVAAKAPDLAEKVKSGELALDRADRIVRDREAQARKMAEATAAAASAPAKLEFDVRLGDFREVLADLSGIDAIITDPPYPTEYLPLLDDLAAWADKVLAPDGILAVLMGQTHLPEVYRRLDGHRPYRWTACYLTPGGAYASHARRLQSNWKPLLIYGGGPRFSDVFQSEGSDSEAKYRHAWGQDYSAFHAIVERLTAPNQTVVDPFCGSGTTLIAAHALGRHAIGADVDAEAIASLRRRMEV